MCNITHGPLDFHKSLCTVIVQVSMGIHCTCKLKFKSRWRNLVLYNEPSESDYIEFLKYLLRYNFKIYRCYITKFLCISIFKRSSLSTVVFFVFFPKYFKENQIHSSMLSVFAILPDSLDKRIRTFNQRSSISTMFSLKSSV